MGRNKQHGKVRKARRDKIRKSLDSRGNGKSELRQCCQRAQIMSQQQVGEVFRIVLKCSEGHIRTERRVSSKRLAKLIERSNTARTVWP